MSHKIYTTFYGNKKIDHHDREIANLEFVKNEGILYVDNNGTTDAIDYERYSIGIEVLYDETSTVRLNFDNLKLLQKNISNILANCHDEESYQQFIKLNMV